MRLCDIYPTVPSQCESEVRVSLMRHVQSSLHFPSWQTCSLIHYLDLWEAFSHASITTFTIVYSRAAVHSSMELCELVQCGVNDVMQEISRIFSSLNKINIGQLVRGSDSEHYFFIKYKHWVNLIIIMYDNENI